MKKIILFAFFITALIIGAFFLYYDGFFGEHPVLFRTTFKTLPDWGKIDTTQTLLAFKNSCTEIAKRNPNQKFGPLMHSKKNARWQQICEAANQLTIINDQIARDFFEKEFIPYHVTHNLQFQGLFTGYYLPEMEGRLKRTAHFNVPIYGLPNDWVKINLGIFKKEWVGQSIVGQVKNNTVLPYPARSFIVNNKHVDKKTILGWTNSPIDYFFAQIQGSVVLKLPRHQSLLLGYAGGNGQPYTAIGKILIEKKAISKEAMSMQAIKTWLLAHPNQLNWILNQNASFVFLKKLETKAPLGAEQISLTPEYSLAVDPHYMAFGTPVFLHISLNKPFNHLMVAQDTGNAIRGIIRGDVYWGSGKEAEVMAGQMKNPGEYWVLLPK